MPRINVLDEDIERGIRENSNACVVAQAIHRHIPTAQRIEVTLQTIRYSREGERHVFLTPLRVQQFIIDYDGGRDVPAFSFTLQNPIKGATVERTPAQKRADAARFAAKREATRAGKDANEIREAGRDAYAESLRASVDAGEQIGSKMKPGKDPSGHVVRRVTPRTYKGGKRSYGRRQLRENQLRDD